MSISDVKIGENLAALRGEMSQKDLAERMASRGWKWSQATVWSVEQAKRPLRLTEAADVAHILGVELRALFGNDSDRWQQMVQGAVTTEIEKVHAAVRELMSVQAFWAKEADRSEFDPEDSPILTKALLYSALDAAAIAFAGEYKSTAGHVEYYKASKDFPGGFVDQLLNEWRELTPRVK